MPNPSQGKSRHVVSDTDMLCALELHVPGIRAMHASLSPLMQDVVNWDKEQLDAMDSRLRRRFKAEQSKVQEAILQAALERSQAKKLDECTFTQEISLYTLLEMNWVMHMLLRAVEDVQSGYSVIYNVLSARIAGRNPSSEVLDNLHTHYGQLNQAKLKLASKLQALTSTITNLAQGYPGMRQATDYALEAGVACTDVRDFLMLLKDSHQTGFEYARRPY